MRATGSARFRGCKHRIDAEFLDGVERNSQTNIRLLGLIYNVRCVDAVVSKVVVVASATGRSNRTLVTASGIDSTRHERREGCPIAAVERQLLYLLRLDAVT